MKNDVIYNGLEEMNNLMWEISSCFGILTTIYNNRDIDENAFGQVALVTEVGIEKIKKLVSKNEELTTTILKDRLRRTKQI